MLELREVREGVIEIARGQARSRDDGSHRQRLLSSHQLERSLDRYLMWGLAFMAVLIAGFIAYRVREPTLRAHATAAQEASYREICTQLFATNCSSCHGKGANGGSAPVLNAKEFLQATTDDQIRALIAGGVSGTDMSPWSLSFGGSLTDEQIRQIVVSARAGFGPSHHVDCRRRKRSRVVAAGSARARSALEVLSCE